MRLWKNITARVFTRLLLFGTLFVLASACWADDADAGDSQEAQSVLENVLSQFSEKTFLTPAPDESSGMAMYVDQNKKSITYHLMLCTNLLYKAWEENSLRLLSNVCSSCEQRSEFRILKKKNKIAIGPVEFTFGSADVVQNALGKVPERFFVRLAIIDQDGYVIAEQMVPTSDFSGNALPQFYAGTPSKYTFTFDNLTEKQVKAARTASPRWTIDTEKELTYQSGLDLGEYKDTHNDTIVKFENGMTLTLINLSPYFSIGKYEVTQGLWKMVMQSNPSWGVRDDWRPVENVSWDQCREMIDKLNEYDEVKDEKLHFRLPTRREWKLACLAGGTGKYGDIEPGEEGSLSKMGWFVGNCKDGKPQIVGHKKPNAFGIFDMHGNVNEWVADGPLPKLRYACGGCYKSTMEECSADTVTRVSRSDGQTGFRLIADTE